MAAIINLTKEAAGKMALLVGAAEFFEPIDKVKQVTRYAVEQGLMSFEAGIDYLMTHAGNVENAKRIGKKVGLDSKKVKKYIKKNREEWEKEGTKILGYRLNLKSLITKESSAKGDLLHYA